MENFRDGYYQGFWGRDIEVIIDLEEIIGFSEVHSTFFQYNLSWIILPTSVTYSISSDGEQFKEIGNIKNDVSAMKEGKCKKAFVLELDTINGRYLKIHAKKFGKLPEEHPAAGSDAWLFIDEIIIN